MCIIDKGVSEKLHDATAKASAKFLEATAEAFLAFKAVEEASDALDAHRTKATKLLDEAAGEYRQTFALSEDLKQADGFLRARPFERLQASFGITPGTLNDVRWRTIARTARESKTPAADLIGVCVAGTETLKHVISTVEVNTTSWQLRRSLYNWSLVLPHGALISDAFDSSVR